MFSLFKKLAGHSAIYGIGLLGSRVAAIILTPMFLHTLNKTEYGTMDLLNVLISMLQSVLMLGMGAILIKSYINDCNSSEERKVLISSTMLFVFLTASILVVVAAFFSKQISTLLFKDRAFGLLVQLAVTGSGMLLIQHVGQLCLRARQQPGYFVLVSLTQLAVIVVLNLYFVGFRKMGVLGVQLAGISGYTVSLGMTLFLIRSEFVARFDWKPVHHVLTLSIPMLPIAVAPFVLNMSDRFFVSHYAGLAATGMYAAGYKIGQLPINLIVNAIGAAWTPLFYANCDKPHGPKLAANMLKYYCLALITGALLLSVFSVDILRVIAGKAYWSSSWIVPYIALSYAIYGIQLYAAPMLIRTNNGKKLSVITIAAAGINLLLNWVLIPRFGISGAVAATFICFFSQSVAVLAYATRYYRAPYEFANIAKLFGAAFLLFLLYRDVVVTSAFTMMAKASVMPALAVLLYVLRFLGKRELYVIHSLPSRVLSRLHPTLRANK